MRVLSGELEAAQQASSGIPYVYAKVGDTDYTPRVKYLRQTEKPFGGIGYMVLSNHDKSISADMRGDMVRVGWGYKIGESQEYSFAPPMWVLRQQGVSLEGKLTVEMELIDIWGKLSLIRVIGGGGVKLTGALEGSWTSGYKVTGGTSGATGTVLRVGDGYLAVVRVDGAFTTETVTYDLDSDIKIVVSAVDDYAGGAPPRWAGTKTYLEIIQDLTDGIVDVVLDSSDGRIDNGSDSPFFETENNTPISDIIQELISRTKCGIRAQDDDGVCKLHIFDASDAPETPHYAYDTDHAFIKDVNDISCVLPNQVIVAWGEFGLSDITAYYGYKKDDAAIARFGVEVSQLLTIEVDSDSDAEDIADAKLNRIQKEATRGSVIAPMNCGQELFDYIKVTDTRAGVENYGWIGTIDRYWNPEGMAHDYDEDHPYRVEIALGNLTSKAISTLPAYPLPPVPTPSPTPGTGTPILVPFHYPASIQGYVHNIEFTAVDWDTVSWSSGIIQFYDGTSHSVYGSSIQLYSDEVVYIYFKLTAGWLQSTTNYLYNCDLDTGLVCIVQRGRADGGEGVPEIKATVLPSSGKMPLICADHIHMSGITMDDISDGGQGEGHFKRVSATDVKAGNIKLTVQQDMENQGYELITNDGATQIIWDAAGIRCYKNGVLQFELRSNDGTAYCAGGDVVLDVNGITMDAAGNFFRIKSGETHLASIFYSAYRFYLMGKTSIQLNWNENTRDIRAWGDDFFSEQPDTVNLGRSDFRWKKIWGGELDVSGDVAAGGDARIGDDIHMLRSNHPSIIYSSANTEGAIGTNTHHPRKIYADYLYYDVNCLPFQDEDDVQMLRDIVRKAGKGRIRSEHFPDAISKLSADSVASSTRDTLKGVDTLRRSGADKQANELEASIPYIAEHRMVDTAAWNTLLMGAIVQQDDRIKQLEARLDSLEGGG